MLGFPVCIVEGLSLFVIYGIKRDALPIIARQQGMDVDARNNELVETAAPLKQLFRKIEEKLLNSFLYELFIEYVSALQLWILLHIITTSRYVTGIV